jgi:hypothetical protein
MALCLMGNLHAGTVEPKQETQKVKSLPTHAAPFQADFYLPEDYVIIAEDEMGPDDFFLVPNDIKKLSLEVLESLKRPLIHVTRINGVKSFKDEMKEIIAGIKQTYPGKIEVTYSSWGSNPLVSIKMKVGQDLVYLAYLGLNDRAENVLLFHLVYPSKKLFGNGNSPSKSDLEFWNNFLSKTKPAG